MIELPALPYDDDALEPHISRATIAYHYGKHTKKYFETVNTLLKGTAFESAESLEQMLEKKALQQGDSALFNNVAQAWNHEFYWKCLTPEAKSGEPSEDLKKAIDTDFGSFETFKKEVIDKATKHFASGWCWVVRRNGKLYVKATPNANTPLTTGDTPLFVIDLWEHAYYLQYPADRATYLKNIWNILNWDFINDNYNKS
jgi:Fe-Mn family superoxide dismutase